MLTRKLHKIWIIFSRSTYDIAPSIWWNLYVDMLRNRVVSWYNIYVKITLNCLLGSYLFERIVALNGRKHFIQSCSFLYFENLSFLFPITLKNIFADISGITESKSIIIGFKERISRMFYFSAIQYGELNI